MNQADAKRLATTEKMFMRTPVHVPNVSLRLKHTIASRKISWSPIPVLPPTIGYLVLHLFLTFRLFIIACTVCRSLDAARIGILNETTMLPMNSYCFFRYVTFVNPDSTHSRWAALLGKMTAVSLNLSPDQWQWPRHTGLDWTQATTECMHIRINVCVYSIKAQYYC
jgi:hypothetical protein